MIIVSFNVNSVRKRAHQLAYLCDTLNPDIICLQETKVQDHDFPIKMAQDLGYHAEFFGQKTHYGVAILSKQAPIFVQKGFNDDADAQKRFIHARFDYLGKSVDVLNGYFPQGERQDHPTKFTAKAKFYADITAYTNNLLKNDTLLLLTGDMNVAPLDSDVGIGESAKARWLQNGFCSFLPIERVWYSAMQGALVDSYRICHPDGDLLSWFDYRSRGFEDMPKRGLRIDHILTNAPKNAIIDAGICYATRGLSEPSDHAPVWAKLAL